MPPMFVLLQEHCSKPRLISTGVDVETFAFRDQFKMGLLSISCVVPGFSTLMFNLIRSRSDQELTRDGTDPWEDEYLKGTGNEMYVVRLFRNYWGVDFHEAAVHVYRFSGIILFGYVHQGQIILNPRDPIPPGALGLLIANSDYAARALGDPTQSENMDTDKASSTRANFNQRSVADGTQRRHLHPVSISASDADQYSKKYLVRSSLAYDRNRDGMDERIMSAWDSDVELDELPPPSSLAHHIIVVIGQCSGIQHFIRPLRNRELILHRAQQQSIRASVPAPVHQQIVVMCAEPWETQIKHFGDLSGAQLANVFYAHAPVKGRYLHRVNARGASRIVVISDHVLQEELEEELNDTWVVFSVLRIRQHLQFIFDSGTDDGRGPEERVMMIGELGQVDAVKYMVGSEARLAMRHYECVADSPLIASGRVMAGSVTHLAMVQTFFNRQFLPVVHAFIGTDRHARGHLLQMSLTPALMRLRTFGDVFSYMLREKGVVVIAIYRNNRHEDCANRVDDADYAASLPCQERDPGCSLPSLHAPLPYVLTGPTADTLMCPLDRLFVLSQGTSMSEPERDDASISDEHGRKESERKGGSDGDASSQPEIVELTLLHS